MITVVEKDKFAETKNINIPLYRARHPTTDDFNFIDLILQYLP